MPKISYSSMYKQCQSLINHSKQTQRLEVSEKSEHSKGRYIILKYLGHVYDHLNTTQSVCRADSITIYKSSRRYSDPSQDQISCRNCSKHMPCTLVEEENANITIIKNHYQEKKRPGRPSRAIANASFKGHEVSICLQRGCM